MKKMMFKIVAGLSEFVPTGAAQFSKTIESLTQSIIDRGKIQNAVNNIFLKVPEKQAKDFVAFILSDEAPLTITTKILILQNFILTSEKFKYVLPSFLKYNTLLEAQLSILLNKHQAMKEPDEAYSSEASSFVSSSSPRVYEEVFGFDESTENLQKALSDFSKKYPAEHYKYAEGQAFVSFVEGLKVTDDVKTMLIEYSIEPSEIVAVSFEALFRTSFTCALYQPVQLKVLYDALCSDTMSSLNNSIDSSCPTFVKKKYDFDTLSQQISKAFEKPKKQDRHNSKEAILSELKNLNSENGAGLKEFVESNRALFAGHPRFMKKIIRLANEKIREAALNPIQHTTNPLYDDTVSTDSFVLGPSAQSN